MPLFRTVVAVSLTSLAVLAGCGSQLSPLDPASSGSFNVTGAWRFFSKSGPFSLAAGLLDTAGHVTGTGTVYGCGGSPEQTTLSGSVDRKGDLTLKTVQLPGGSILTLQGQLSEDGKSAGDATLLSSGSECGAPAAAPVTAQVYAPATGSYIGNFVGTDGQSTPVSATLSQSSNPGPGGGYTLSGAVSFPSSPCLATAAIAEASSTVAGGTLAATYSAAVGGQPVTITAAGTANATADTITITHWTIAGGPCDGYSGTGMLQQ